MKRPLWHALAPRCVDCADGRWNKVSKIDSVVHYRIYMAAQHMGPPSTHHNDRETKPNQPKWLLIERKTCGYKVPFNFAYTAVWVA